MMWCVMKTEDNAMHNAIADHNPDTLYCKGSIYLLFAITASEFWIFM